MLPFKSKIMRQKTLRISGLLLVAFAFFLASCSKTGPAGPAGATGATGATGPAGPAGPSGSTGILYSPWLNVQFSQVFDTNWVASIVAPALTDSILNSGEVKVYFNAGSDSTGNQFVLPLPVFEPYLFTDSTGKNSITLMINSYFSDTTITIVSNEDISSFVDNSGYHNWQFRYIIIPGGTKTSLPNSISGAKDAIDWNNYSQVKAYLKLPD